MGQGLTDNPISKEFAKILKPLKVKRGRKQEAVYRKGLGLYSLRHTFQTIGDGARDPIATRTIMGHAEASRRYVGGLPRGRR